MNNETYYLRGTSDHLSVMGHLTACNKCGRKVLVEMGLIGVPHHVGVSVTCCDCLVLSEHLRKEQPEVVAKIDGWLQGGQETVRTSS